MPEWAGKTLGKVLIHDLIARGGMAEVYTGMHDSYGLVAVKLMRGLLERDSDQLARFKREAEVIEGLRHPNIVQMFDYALVDESPYLIMEYIPGPSLAMYLKKLHDQDKRLPIGIVAQVLKSIASALDYAHLKGLVHRDIKPANVLLRSSGEPIELDKPLPPDVEPVLTDFGLVRLLDSTMLTTAGSVSGTPTYMSPEQARGEKVDKSTDIYSLGIMLYEMLAGTVPFQADTTFGMLMKHINEPPPPIPGISPDLQTLLNRALAKNPARRYESAGDLANEFIALFNGQTISPGTLHVVELARQEEESQKITAQPPARRFNWLRIGIEIAVVILLAFVIYQFIGPQVTAVATTPTLDPNNPVGRMRFSFSSQDNDTVALSVAGVPRPEENTHYEAWLVYDDGTFRDLGRITFEASGIGRLEVTGSGMNLLDGIKELRITQEQNDIEVSSPTGEVVLSSVFPPQALVHIRNLAVSFEDTPDNLAIIQGLYYFSGSYLNDAINGTDADPNYIPISQAYDEGDETTLRQRNEELINMIVGSQSDQYADYDEDDQVEDIADGYGSLPNGEQPGYLQLTAQEAQAAADAPDSTPNIRLHNESLQICLQNMQEWTNEILPLALALNDTPFGPEMEPVISQLSFLGNALLNGRDVDENGQVDPREGECGAELAYRYGTNMADFQLFPGAERVPPSGR
ncbi:MAG: serine/threonine protein kinase [Chloroflexota bacterium]|nr:serine/threonine protein kinase [Chloroflexota bacterium]